MEELISLGKQLWDNPEPGFSIEEFENIPGFIAKYLRKVAE